ncbi:MAG: tetratricopeptide repeat protein [Acidobacteria bacterium]|nr:MAG: tetratricopeptide repeat protein [Acidobacteriota bacterium]
MAHLGFLAARDPLFLSPVVDSWFHVSEAQQILQLGPLLPGTGAFYKGPLYSYVLAAGLALFGTKGGLVAGYILSVALGTLSVWLIARIADRLGGPKAAWLAGLGAAAYGTAVYFDATLLLVPLVTLLLLAAADRLVAAGTSRSPQRSLRAAGLLLGLVCITRANGLLTLGVVCLWAMMVARGKRWRRVSAWRAAWLVLLPAAVAIAPVTARNTILEQDPVIVSWNGGINLFMGNDPGFDQTSGNWHPDLAWMRLDRAPNELGWRRGAGHQRFFIRQAVLSFADNPLLAVAILGHKAALLLTSYEIPNNRRMETVRGYSPVFACLTPRFSRFVFPFILVAPLIGAGLVFLDARRVREAAPLFLISATWAVTPILFFNTARYRLPSILVLLPVAAACWGSPSTTRSRRRVAAAAFVALSLITVAILTVPAHPTLPPSDEVQMGNVAVREQRWDDAVAWFKRAVETEPEDPMGRMRLGDALQQQGKHGEAIAQYSRVADNEGLAADWRNAAMRSTAQTLLKMNRFAEAERCYRRLLDSSPDKPWTNGRPDFHLRGTPPIQACHIRLEMVAALVALGRADEALAETDRVGADCRTVPALRDDATTLRGWIADRFLRGQ